MARVFIDPGHGGTDSGAVGNGLREKDLTLKISLYARDYLLSNYSGVKVRLSRTTDKTVSLKQRTDDANKWGATVLVSVHINAAGSASATGYEDFIYNGTVSQATRNLQNTVHAEMSKLFSGFRNRGKKRANFHMLRESRMPAILPEFLFITNKNDAAFLRKKSNLKRIGETLAIAIAKHLKLKAKSSGSTTKPSTGSSTLYRVRKSWSDSKSQIGAYSVLANAKKVADDNASKGYKVFDGAGKVVYTPKAGTTTYIVKKGDTLWGISQKYGVTVSALKKANGLKSDTISIGQKLTIPKSEGGAGAPVSNPAPPKKEEPKKETPKPVDEHKGHTSILGKSEVAPEKLAAFVKANNPTAQDIDEISKAFIEVGNTYGIRGDIAFCQSILETGWFTYKGSAVTPDQHNYCGLGVVSNGVKGHSFDTVKDGVTAQIQHLYAYATTKPLPSGEKLIDPRFKYVTRGVAPHWEDLSMRWAMNENYGTHILAIYDNLKKFEYIPEDKSVPVEEKKEKEELNVKLINEVNRLLYEILKDYKK